MIVFPGPNSLFVILRFKGVLRHFPHVLMIDTEGNTDHCVNHPDIPEFIRIKTKDSRRIMQIMDDVAMGKIKFPDGSPVETFCIDSISVLWSVQQEVAAVNAENRAVRYNKSPDTANMTQLDWVLAKRPMKRIANRINGTKIKYLIFVAREKDLYEEDASTKESKKIGFQPDVMKGTEFEMNLIFHHGFDGNGWFAEATKTQGALNKLFTMNERIREFPINKILEYTKDFNPEQAEDMKDAEEIAQEIASENAKKHSQTELIEYAKQHGLKPEEVGPALKAAGFQEFDPIRWKDMQEAILAYRVPAAA
jgi:hypothetical protein